MSLLLLIASGDGVPARSLGREQVSLLCVGSYFRLFFFALLLFCQALTREKRSMRSAGRSVFFFSLSVLYYFVFIFLSGVHTLRAGSE